MGLHQGPSPRHLWSQALLNLMDFVFGSRLDPSLGIIFSNQEEYFLKRGSHVFGGQSDTKLLSIFINFFPSYLGPRSWCSIQVGYKLFTLDQQDRYIWEILCFQSQFKHAMRMSLHQGPGPRNARSKTFLDLMGPCFSLDIGSKVDDRFVKLGGVFS